MERRKFLKRTLSYGTATGASLVLMGNEALKQKVDKKDLEN